MRKIVVALIICIYCLFVHAQESENEYEYNHNNDTQFTPKLNFRSSVSNKSPADSEVVINETLINGALFNQQKVTPNPNESIEPFSGSLKLSYTDFSVPVAPGLNIEFNRTYSSDYGNKDQFKYHKHYDQQPISQAWNFQSDYIHLAKKCKTKVSNNICKPVYVTSKGQKLVLFANKNRPGEFRTINNWQGKIEAGIYTLTDPKGFKYYFGHGFELESTVRFYLTKIATPAGQYIAYTYDRSLLKQITSSNLNQVLDIQHQQFKTKDSDGNHIYFYVPTRILYNNSIVANYNYNFFVKHGCFILTSVNLFDGRYWKYAYSMLPDSPREFLTYAADTNSITNYTYAYDTTLAFYTNVYAERLSSISRTEGGVTSKWNLTKSDGMLTDGHSTKLVTIKNDHYTTVNKYYNFENNNVWMTGLLAESTIYKAHAIQDNEILQKTVHKWQPVLHNNEPHKTLVYILDGKYSGPLQDSKTYRVIPTSVTLTRGKDIYRTEYFDYDDYDNATRIVQAHGDKSREIKQEYLNIVDKNILGLRTKLLINNKVINQQEYDHIGNVIQSSSFNKHNIYTYNNGLLASDTDIMGNTTYYDNYYAGIPQYISYPDGTHENKVINTYGQPSLVTNPRGYTANYLYDALGRIEKQTPAIGSETNYQYPSGNNILEHGTYKEVTINNSYGMPVKKTLGSKKEIIYRYDAMGRKIFQSFVSSINNAIAGHSYTYDSLNRLTTDCYTSKISNTDNCTRYTYLDNNTVAVYYPTGEYKITTSFGFDGPEHDKIVKIKEDNRETVINRDDLGYVTSVKQGNVSKVYHYDKNYNLIKYTEPETGVTEYKHDKLGNITEKKNDINIIKYTYHPKNYKLEQEEYSDKSPTLIYKYDSNNNIISASKGRINWAYKYDEIDRVISEELNIKNYITLKTKNQFNHDGHLEKIIYPDKSEFYLNPNEYGQPTSIGNKISNISYHPMGHWEQMRLGSNQISSGLDSYSRVNQFNYGTLKLNYLYDLNNNLLQLDLSDSLELSYQHQYDFSYDKLGRITSAKMANGQVDYLYDENDNLLSLKSSLTSLNQNPKINTLSPVNNSNLIFSYNNMQVVSIANASSPNKVAYSYDTLGNVLADNWSKYNYGVDGNLYSMSGKHYGNYEYDYNQQRVYQETKTIYGKEDIVTFYNKAGLALYDYNITKHKSNKYLYLNGQRIGKIAADIKDNINQNSITSYYYNDAQGSPLAEIDEQGKTLWREAYLPFGAKLLDEIDISVNKFGFVGKEFDESGLSYFGARYYNPVSGRFMAPDPADVKPEVPGTFNRYAYGYNNPYKYVDPDGRQIAPLPVMMAEFAVGGVAGALAGWKEAGAQGAIVGAFFGGTSAVVGSVFSGGAAGALAARSFVKGATTLAIDVSTNAAGSVARSYVNTGKLELNDAMTGAVYGAGANRWMHRYGQFSTKTAAEAFTSGKYAALTSAAAEGMHSNYFKNHSFAARNTSMTTQIIKYN